ncbi:IS30 family transposase [Lentilactobacillus sp. Marseille-Q4993]|uniref:IS30 family transposase n=1 Tax=Lentilactobacillus sp. Marseille-Q4993 TaxID=3039492 RepID=UPI0032DE84D2
MSHYKHLTIEERETIFLMNHRGYSLHLIANTIDRSPATISRELRRNTTNKRYSPSRAQSKYQLRKRKCGRKRLIDNPKVFETIRELFCEDQWSPEQISNRLKIENHKVQLSSNTIYRAVYSGKLDGHFKLGSKAAIRHLRHHGKSRHTKDYQKKRGKIRITNRIYDRPSEADNRIQRGH